MEIMSSERVGSKDCTKEHIKSTESIFMSTTFYEAQITNLFLPWLTDQIPDEAWTSLQINLNKLIKSITSKNQNGRT